MTCFSTRPLGRSNDRGQLPSESVAGQSVVRGPSTALRPARSEVDDIESGACPSDEHSSSASPSSTPPRTTAPVTASGCSAKRSPVIATRWFIATKFGYHVDDASSTVRSYGSDEADSDVAGHLHADLEASLQRLDTDYVDVYQLHVGSLTLARALEARDVLDELVAEGKARTYGWSTDRADVIRPFATSPGCGVVQQGLSVLDDTNPEMLAFVRGARASRASTAAHSAWDCSLASSP